MSLSGERQERDIEGIRNAGAARGAPDGDRPEAGAKLATSGTQYHEHDTYVQRSDDDEDESSS